MSPLLPVEDDDPAAPCDPTVLRYGRLVDGHIVRCTCGVRDTEWPTRRQAEAHADRHRRGEDEPT